MKDTEVRILSYITVISIVILMISSCVNVVVYKSEQDRTEDIFSTSVEELNTVIVDTAGYGYEGFTKDVDLDSKDYEGWIGYGDDNGR